MRRILQKILACQILLFITIAAWSQVEYHIKNYGINDDLRVRGKTCIAQLNGFIWIGSNNGFCIFDGNYTHQYKIPDTKDLGGYYCRVTALTTWGDNELWIGSRQGLYMYDTSMQKLTEIKVEGLPERADVASIQFGKKGFLWAIISGKAYMIDVQQKKAKQIGEGMFSPTCLTVTRNGAVWLGDASGILYRYDVLNDRLRSYEVKPEGVEQFSYIINITEMRNGDLAVVSSGDGACLFSTSQLTSRMLLTHDEEGFPITAHTAMTPVGDELWIGTERGIVIYRIRDGRIRGIRQSRHSGNSLSDNAVHSLFLDDENGVWVGTFFGGMNRISLSSHNFNIFLPKEDEEEDSDVNVIREICEDKYGHIWVGTEDDGLYLLNEEKRILQKANINWGSHPAPFNVQSLTLKGDDLWVSTILRGIYVIDTKSMTLKNQYEKTNKTKVGTNILGATLCHQNGTLFVGSSMGVYIFNEKDESFNPIPELNNTSVRHLYADRHGNVWVASINKGLWKIQQHTNGGWRAKKTSFSYKCANVVMEDSKGLYWIGTDIHGLMSYDEKTGKTEKFTKSERLSQQTVTNIIEDYHHRLWISTFDGLYSYNLDKQVLNHQTIAHDLPSNYLNYSSGYVDQKGQVYIGTYNGLVRFDPASFTLSRQRLKPYFLRLFVKDKLILPNDETGILAHSLSQTEELKLTYDQNTFTIHYAVSSYDNGEVVWFRYRLNPDEPWIVSDNAHPIRLTDLSSGTYKITLQASYNPERWEGDAAVIFLTIAPPIWRNPAVIVGYIALIVIAVVVIMMALRNRSRYLGRKKTNE